MFYEPSKEEVKPSKGPKIVMNHERIKDFLPVFLEKLSKSKLRESFDCLRPVSMQKNPKHLLELVNMLNQKNQKASFKLIQ